MAHKEMANNTTDSVPKKAYASKTLRNPRAPSVAETPSMISE